MLVMTEPRKAYTIEEVAEVLQVNPRTINRMLDRGELKGFKVGRLWRISQEALDAYMRGEQPGDQS
ncbi:MAG: helix-turn-helix domain-containing protein [Dehalococcoidia bacterium]